ARGGAKSPTKLPRPTPGLARWAKGVAACYCSHVVLRLGMTATRMTLKPGDLAHWLASSLYEHVGLLRDPASKGELRRPVTLATKLPSDRLPGSRRRMRR